MRQLLRFMFMFSMLAWCAGCAELDECPQGQRLIDGACTPPPPACAAEVAKPIQVGCAFDLPLPLPGLAEVAYFSWELTVKPGRIISDERFGVTFEGRMLIDPAILNLGQVALGAHHRIGLAQAEATVQVRKGAQSEGGDVVLDLKPIQKACVYDEAGRRGPEAGPFPLCDEAKDREDGANDDCLGLDGVPDSRNSCLPHFRYTMSEDCSDSGPCAALGETGPGSACDLNGFCVSEALVIDLAEASGAYVADSSGSVLFGWADEGNVEPLESGPNRGAYNPSDLRRSFGDEIVLSGFDVRFGNASGLDLAFECVMGVNSRGPDGVPTVDILVSPSPDGALISCPIQEPE